jgi:hypothetical protein
MFEEIAPRPEDISVLFHAFNLLELVVSRLPKDRSDLVCQYFDRIVISLEQTCTTQPVQHIRIGLQQCYLSMLGVLFREHGVMLIRAGPRTIALLLTIFEKYDIPLLENLMVALGHLLSRLRKVHVALDPDLGARLDGFVQCMRVSYRYWVT